MNHDAPAPIRAPRVGALDAQENHDPNHGGAGSYNCLVVAKSSVDRSAPVKAAATGSPVAAKTPPLKHRRPLQSIKATETPRLLPIQPSSSPGLRAVDSQQAPALPSSLIVRVPGAAVGTTTPIKRPLAPLPAPHHSGEGHEAYQGQFGASGCGRLLAYKSMEPELGEDGGGALNQSLASENLAWMDMMLALLENRYGAKHSIPISIADLEDAKMFQSQAKKRRIGDSSASIAQPVCNDPSDRGEHKIRNRDTVSVAALPPREGTGNPMAIVKPRATEPSRTVHSREERDREERRQRLLLRHAYQIQASSVASSTSCGCKTGCLKLYCMCFSSRGYCHPSCTCGDCKNNRQNKEQRLVAIQSYLANDPRTFSYASQHMSASTTGFMQLLPQRSNAVVQRGCRCKKSKCLKKYCECFLNGIACTAHCRCVDCSNHSKSAHHLQNAVAKQQAVEARSEQQPFHQIKVTVTKKPKRNHVRKSIRLNL